MAIGSGDLAKVKSSVCPATFSKTVWKMILQRYKAVCALPLIQYCLENDTLDGFKAFSKMPGNVGRKCFDRITEDFVLFQDEVKRKKEQDSRTLYIRLECLHFETGPYFVIQVWG